ncbi:hypothetical protein KBC59_01995 [Patescibacteria group bacterium]|jgi:hypothetical protein|nr:hypothetical protein [Patescibacteria group bacterium]
MHPYLAQIGPCIEKMKKIEGVLDARKVTRPDSQLVTEPESLVFIHKVSRGDRSIHWGINGSLKAHAFQRDDHLCAFVYIQFHKRDRSVVKLAFNPLRKKWSSDLTIRELKILEDVLNTEDTDPDRLAREIRAGSLDEDQFTQELETRQALEVISIMARWFQEAEEPRRTQTLSGVSRRTLF